MFQKELEMATNSRKETRARGLKHFFTGKPCKNRHLAQRFASSGTCVECHSRRWRSGRPDGKTYKENPEYINVLPIPAEDDTKLVDLSRPGFSKIGLDPEKRLRTQEWQSSCLAMSKIGSGRQWIIGDLWNHREDGTKAEYMDSIGIKPKSAEQYGWVCRVFPMDMRRANLTFSHHRAIAVSELFRTDQEKICAQDHVEINGMSVRQTEKWIKKMQPTTTRVEVDPVMADLRAVVRAVKDTDTVPADVVAKIKELKELLESS